MFPEDGGGGLGEVDAGFAGAGLGFVGPVNGTHEGVAEVVLVEGAEVGKAEAVAEFVDGALELDLFEEAAAEVVTGSDFSGKL